MNTYTLGSTVRLSFTFSLSGVGQNPTTVMLEMRAPDNSSSTPTPVSDGNGAYHLDYIPALSGLFRWRAVGTGFTNLPSAAIAQEGVFSVAQSYVLNP